jgi:hypothetical protein
MRLEIPSESAFLVAMPLFDKHASDKNVGLMFTAHTGEAQRVLSDVTGADSESALSVS